MEQRKHKIRGQSEAWWTKCCQHPLTPESLHNRLPLINSSKIGIDLWSVAAMEVEGQVPVGTTSLEHSNKILNCHIGLFNSPTSREGAGFYLPWLNSGPWYQHLVTAPSWRFRLSIKNLPDHENTNIWQILGESNVQEFAAWLHDIENAWAPFRGSFQWVINRTIA